MKIIDNFINKIGIFSSYLIYLMVFLIILTLILRYIFNIGSIALQELIMYFHAIFFLFGISVAIKESSHVKIDILSNKLSDYQNHIIYILGLIFFMIPFALFVIGISMDMVIKSWKILEQSSESGGLELVYILKSLIPLSGLLIFIQSISELIKTIKYIAK